VNVGLLALGSLLAAVGISSEAPQAAAEPEAARLTHRHSCPIDGPRLETIQPARRASGTALARENRA
ncbi:MAG: hypothetical protein ACRD2T_08430, partial [Thermoanaerobaculia bacterium]